MGSPDLGSVMLAFYRLEINCGLQSFWDGGWEVWIGDEMNGRRVSANFEPECRQRDVLTLMARWLIGAAIEAYPLAREELEVALDTSSLEGALRRIRDLCPVTDPGPALHPLGGWKSDGNTDDVAEDAVNEALWEVAVIADRALAVGTTDRQPVIREELND